jgi:DNA-binding IclR family transcriptional regulator
MVSGSRGTMETESEKIGRRRRLLDRIQAGGGLQTSGERATTTSVQVLDRCIAILDAVEGGARSYTDVVRDTGLSRPTAHRLIQGLEDHGFLIHVGGFGYVLGTRFLGLAATAMRELPLRELAHPILERLSRTTGESAQLYVRDGDRRICVDAVESANELRTIVEIGASLPLVKGSAGKVFLAWLDDDRRTRILETVDEVDSLDRQLHTVRRRGWAESVAEREPGVASVSAPVFGPDRTLLAAVSVSGPASRLGNLRSRRYAPAVVDAARQIEGALGVSPGPR